MFPEEFPSCSESLRDLTWLSLAGEPSMLEEFPFLPKSPPSVQTSSLGTALCQKFPFPGCSIVPCHQKLPGILLGSTTSTGTQQKQSKEIFFFFFRLQPQLLALLQAPEPFPDRKVHPGIKKKNKIRGSVLLSSVSWMSSSWEQFCSVYNLLCLMMRAKILAKLCQVCGELSAFFSAEKIGP